MQGTDVMPEGTVGHEQVITKFGQRTVSDQNFSKIVALPKQALYNCGENVRRVRVELVQTKTEKFLKLTPIVEGE